jgi:hypothetical protein
MTETPEQIPDESGADESPNPSLLRGIFASPFSWLAAFLILNLSVQFLNISTRVAALFGALAVTFAFVSIVVLFAVSVARKKLPLLQILAWGVLALALWLAIDYWISPAIRAPILAAAREARTRPQGWALFQLISLGVLSDMALLILAICAGNLASRLIQTPNMLGPVCAVIALVDVWGVLFGGIVSQLMEKAPTVAAKAMTSGPKIGAAVSSRYTIPLPDVGVGDYLFIGLLFGALVWLRLNWRDAMKWVVPLISLALLAIVFLPQVPALPGLFFIALGVIIPNTRTFHYTRDEKFALIYAAIFVAILTVGLYFFLTSQLPEKPPAKPRRAEYSARRLNA